MVADMAVDKVADKIKIGQHGHWTWTIIGHGRNCLMRSLPNLRVFNLCEVICMAVYDKAKEPTGFCVGHFNFMGFSL